MGCVCGKINDLDDSRESPSTSRPRIAAPPRRGSSAAAATVSAQQQVPGAVIVTQQYQHAALAKHSSRPSETVLAPERKHMSGPIGSSSAAAAAAAAGVRGMEKRRHRERTATLSSNSLRLSSPIPKAEEGEQVAAGWPSWLATFAGEAIRGWVPRRADSFERLEKIGQGTYSNVYRAHDLDKEKFVALKKVRFDNLEPESIKFMAREILILRRLNHPNIIQLEGLVTSQKSQSLYLVFEYMEHDLSGLASFPGLKFTEPQMKCYMQQLLQGLEHCHINGVLHRDIKGSNLLIDNNGILKIADFGLASTYHPGQDHHLTSRVVTLWYRPPELLLGATNYGPSVDLWSAGCILAELYAGKPIMPGRTEVEQLHKIFKLCGSPSEEYWRKSKLPHATVFKPQHPYRRCVSDVFKDFPPPAFALVDTLLSVDPADRGTASSALKSEFFTTKPLACDPSSLPKYPPSKEIDAKRREEENRRHGNGGMKNQKVDQERRPSESKAVPAPDANAELVSSLQKRHNHANSQSRSEVFTPKLQEVALGNPIKPSKPAFVLGVAEDAGGVYNSNKAYFSGPLNNHAQSSKIPRDEVSPRDVSKVGNLPVVPAILSKKKVLSETGGEKGNTQVESNTWRSSASINEGSGDSRNNELMVSQNDQKINEKDSQMLGHGSKSNKIHFSGPLVSPSCNVDQMLKDHDRQLQEVSRRSRAEKSRHRKRQGEVQQSGIKPSDFGIAPVYPSSRGASTTPFTSSNVSAP